MQNKIENIAKKVLLKCMGLKPDELLLIVTDEGLKDIAYNFFYAAKSVSKQPAVLNIKPGQEHGQEPPRNVAQAILYSEVGLLITSKSLSHTKARKKASDKGVRIASMPGITLDIVECSLDIDYSTMKKKLLKFAQILSRAKKLSITTDAGTDIEMNVRGRKSFIDDGLYLEKGCFGNLPAGEVCLAPLEGTTEGSLVIDGSFPEVGKLKHPMKVYITKGEVRHTEPTYLNNRLSKYGKSAFNIAEFGIGFNPKAKVSGNVLEDEKAIGTAHIAFGDNRSFGGKVRAGCHLDAVFLNPKLVIDGRPIRPWEE